MKRSTRAAAAALTVLAVTTALAGPSASAQSAAHTRAESRGGHDDSIQRVAEQVYADVFSRGQILDTVLLQANDLNVEWVAIQEDVTRNITDDQGSVGGMLEQLYQLYFPAQEWSDQVVQRPMPAKRTLRLLKRLAHRVDSYRAGQYRVAIADLVTLDALRDKTLEAQLILEGASAPTEDLGAVLAAIDDAARAAGRITAKTKPQAVKERHLDVQEVGNDYREIVLGAVEAATLDTDGDGLTDVTEATLGTNPNLADTDGDGVSDGDEVAAGTDPTHPPVVGPCPSPIGACRSTA